MSAYSCKKKSTTVPFNNRPQPPKQFLSSSKQTNPYQKSTTLFKASFC